MKFGIFGIWERIYKIVIALLVSGITIWSSIWYLSPKDKSDTFIISSLYALFLFVIGVYMNYIKNRIDEKFYDRKDYYIMLSRLSGIFSTMDFEDYSDRDISMATISFKTFTSRTDGMKDVPPYIAEKGFRFQNKELSIEDEFLEKRSCLVKKLNDNVLNYIETNAITKAVPYPHINDVNFEVREWCNEHCRLDKAELNKMETYIYSLFSELQNEFDDLQSLMKRITKLYRTYKEKVEWNIITIERTYGKRLEYEFYKENEYINEIKSIKTLIEQVQNNMYSYDECVELSNDIGECKEGINALHDAIHLLEDNLTSEISDVKDELHDKF